MSRQIQSLTLADARRLIDAGEKKAQEMRIPYNIAVVDAGGSLIAHARMDDAWMGSVDIAMGSLRVNFQKVSVVRVPRS